MRQDSQAYLPTVDHTQVRPFFEALPSGEVTVCAFGAAPKTTVTADVLAARVNRPDEAAVAAAEASRAAAETDAFERGQAAGLTQGRAEGIETGKVQGAAAKQAELTPQLEAVAAMAEAFTAAGKKAEADARQAAIQLAFRLAERIVQRHLDDSDVLGARLAAALDGVSDALGERIRIRTAPTQLEVFRAIADNDGTAELDLHFEADRDLAMGDLIIDCAGRQVSSIVTDQLARLEEALADG